MTRLNEGWQEDAVAHAAIPLRIAGWNVELRASPAELAARIAPRYAAYRVAAPADPDLVVEVQHEAGGRAEAAIVNPQGVLQAKLTQAQDDYLLDSGNAYGRITLSRGRAALRFRSTGPSSEVEYFLRVAVALFALSRDGLLIHCAALKRSDLVYLFVGQSGSGKSTVVALSRASAVATALGDDLVVLRRDGAGWVAHGTPFWNAETVAHDGEHETGRVAHIYKLIQDRSVYVETMGRAAATAELVANCPVVNGQPELLPLVIERCREVASAAGVGALHFRKDDSFWSVVG